MDEIVAEQFVVFGPNHRELSFTSESTCHELILFFEDFNSLNHSC